MKRVLRVTYEFLLECIVGILLLFLIFISKNEVPPMGRFVGVCLFGMITFTFLLIKVREKGKWLFFITVLPALLLLGKLMNIPVFLGFLLGLVIYWRVITLFDDPPEGSGAVLLLSFLLGLIAIVYAAISGYRFQTTIILVLLIQVFLVVSGSFFRKWSSISTNKVKFAFYFFKIITAIALIGTVFTFSLKFVQLAFFAILQILVLILSKMAVPVLYGIQFLIRLFGGKERKPPNFEVDSQQYEAFNFKDQSYLITEDMIYIFLSAVAILIICYVIYKKKLRLLSMEPNSSSTVESFENVVRTRRSLFGHKKLRAPEDPIRKEIYELERYAQKCKLARLPFETLDEWWERIGLTGSQEIIEIYEKVRYGGLVGTTLELLRLKKEIEFLKQQMKGIHKSDRK
jgi:hypothetical protein